MAVSHGIRIIYDRSGYKTQFDIRSDSIFGLNFGISGSGDVSVAHADEKQSFGGRGKAG